MSKVEQKAADKKPIGPGENPYNVYDSMFFSAKDRKPKRSIK